jgi:pimeloyl-ACP methyl ester carboxylesterase
MSCVTRSAFWTLSLSITIANVRGLGLLIVAAFGLGREPHTVSVAMGQIPSHAPQQGNMVGYALAAQYPDGITKWVVIDAPLPGTGTSVAPLATCD